MAEKDILEELTLEKLEKDLDKIISDNPEHKKEIKEQVAAEHQEAKEIKNLAATGALAGKIAGVGKTAGAATTGAAFGAGGVADGWAASQAISFIAPGLWIFLSILLYVSDRFITGFNGVPASTLWHWFSSLTPEGILRKILLIAIFALIWFLLTKQKETDKKLHFASSMVLTSVIGIIIFLGTFNIGLLHIAFALILYLGLAKNAAKQMGMSMASLNYTFAAILAIDFFGYGILNDLMTRFGTIPLSFDLSNRFLVPIWFFFVLYLTANYKKSIFTKIITSAVILLIAFNLIGDYQVAKAGEFVSSEQNIQQFKEATGVWNKSVANMKDFIGAIYDPISCISFINEPDKYSQCIKNKQIARHPELNASNIRGAIDKELTDITKVEFVKPSNFPYEIQKEFTPRLPASYILDISTPKNIKIKLSCRFKKGEEEIKGNIGPEQIIAELENQGISEPKKQTIFCTPETDYIEGRYKVIFDAEIQGIETQSWLTRLFTGSKISDKRINELKSLYKLKNGASRSGKEFAAFSFNFGPSAEKGKAFSSVLKDEPVQLLEGGIENLADGQITKINSIKIDLIDGISSPSKECLTMFDYSADSLMLRSGINIQNIDIQKGKPMPILGGCYFRIDDKLRNPEIKGKEFVPETFSATMSYSYKIQKQESFEVKSKPRLSGAT